MLADIIQHHPTETKGHEAMTIRTAVEVANLTARAAHRALMLTQDAFGAYSPEAELAEARYDAAAEAREIVEGWL